MIEWFSQHGVELAAFVFTLIVTIVGWALEHRSSKEQNREREDDIRFLREQLDSLQRQATTLEEQTAMQRADHDRPPFSDAEWVRGSIRRVRIEGSRPVHVESAAPKKDTYLFQLKTQLPDDFVPSETIEYAINGPGPVEFLWRWADEPNMPLRKVRKVAYKPE
ncbi:hypothetical protein GA607_03780 [Bifidobacterium adolescentis]|nr:hypothetical protein GA606_05280 [Bifidobacterium adolescentis]KAB5920359.1 hypothetical protein GA608_04275 [Bifidobacterium adolescentis]KAB5922886.1 hypothetical protein GA607_03780 [Bifidobacterium adolescentis]KAB5925954.1 hypothetical protein GA605_04285 [Bifidobacterium adolescentis]KAB5927574.1 hypothetical protein GA611_04280 [Bifidobacterium adolescentis]